MKIRAVNPQPWLQRRPYESEETKQIRQFGNEIKKIKWETEYIQQTGKEPPKTPNYYKKLLNIV